MPRSSRRLGDIIRELSANPITVILENSGPGATATFDKDDVKSNVLKRMVAHAIAVTVAEGNEPAISDTPGRTSLRDSNGDPIGIQSPGLNNQEHYTENFNSPSPDGGPSAETIFRASSTHGVLDLEAAEGGEFQLKKGKSSSQAPNVTDIFKDVNDRGESSDFVGRVRTVNAQNNILTLESPFFSREGLASENGTVTEEGSNVGFTYTQQEFGKHAPRKFPDTVGNNSVLVKIKDLKKIGLLAMLQSSGEYYIPQDPKDVAQQLASRGASLAPGLARIGQKIDVGRVLATKVLKDIDPKFTKLSLEDNLQKDPILSYGSVNNWMAPFDGLSSTATISGAALLALTVGGLIKSAALLITAQRPAFKDNLGANPTRDDRRRRLGSFLAKNGKAEALRGSGLDLDIADTNHDYFDCVSKGIDIFFGVSTPGNTALKVVKNQGYYNTILRSLVRSTTDFLLISVGGSLVDVEGSRPRNINDVTILGNPLGPIELVKKFNESRLLGFCNILATIGDIALNHGNDGFLLDENGEVNEFISDIDRLVTEASVGPDGSIALNPAVIQSADRLGGRYRNALAWGSQTAKSMYLIPNSMFRAESAFLGAGDQSKNPTEALAIELSNNDLSIVKGPIDQSGNRISAADVESLEEYLGAQYMPFYFHDIRTNEIISFHAFLNNMSDSFDADYTETTGYGRIGKVSIYNNTQRSISLSFKVVATEEQDFDAMWYKINKLITLVYPQYTEGRQVGTSTSKFIQPFSQIPSASPLVRLRLGDIWKSNYSRFGVARLFGVGNNQFSLEGQNSVINRNAIISQKTREITARMSQRGEYQIGEHAILTPLPQHTGRGAGRRVLGFPRAANTVDESTALGQTGRPRTPANIGSAISVTNSTSAGGRTTGMRDSPGGAPLLVSSETRVRIIAIINSPTATDLKQYRFVVADGSNAGENGVFLCSQFDLRPEAAEIQRLAFNQSQSQSPARTNAFDQTLVANFFNPDGNDGNSIIKAFESTKGKGLAGFIKNLKFDWEKAVWETGRHNARAPMSVDISMDFAPIHDINPGLDSEGFMTAPVYNVGNAMKTWHNGMPSDKNQADREALIMAKAQELLKPRSSGGNGR